MSRSVANAFCPLQSYLLGLQGLNLAQPENRLPFMVPQRSFIISFYCLFMFSQTSLRDPLVSPLRSLNICIISILIFLPCFSALLHFSGPSVVGFLIFSGEISLWLLLVVFTLESRHLDLRSL